jgi:hypothetical protein
LYAVHATAGATWDVFVRDDNEASIAFDQRLDKKTRTPLVPAAGNVSWIKGQGRLMFTSSYSCVNMYLGTLYISTKFRPDRISNMAVRPGGHLGKSTKSY